MAQAAGKTAFVFAGGGSLGAVQVGMLRMLLSAGVQPDFVVDSSIGAINASYFAGSPNLEGVTKLERTRYFRRAKLEIKCGAAPSARAATTALEPRSQGPLSLARRRS